MYSKLAKEILNYYATYTETRFTFRRLLQYKWSNDSLSKELDIFTDISSMLFGFLKGQNFTELRVSPKQYEFRIDGQDVASLVTSTCLEYTDDMFMSRYQQILTDSADTPDAESGAFRESSRQFINDILNSLQKSVGEEILNRINTLGAKNIDHSFNAAQWRSDLRSVIEKVPPVTIDAFASSVCEALNSIAYDDIVLFDLFDVLYSLKPFLVESVPYLFFHSFKYSDADYPLVYTEIDIRFETDLVAISFPRDLVMFNVPAVNNADIGSVLAMPRSGTMNEVGGLVAQLQRHVQSEFSYGEDFMYRNDFSQLVHPGHTEDNQRPTISPRIGIQIIRKEDKKLLDYSEIMANLSNGTGSHFADLITSYIEGSVDSTTIDSNRQFKDDYSKRSVATYMPVGPIPLNESQKRILYALKNDRNKLVVVDGPPGTGKSHTISAIVYWANQQNKSVVITSHKETALDVLDRSLSDAFADVHPNSKAPLLRLSDDDKTKTKNSFANTLSTPAVSSAGNIVNSFNVEAVNVDYENEIRDIEKQLQEFIADSALTQQHITEISKLIPLQQQIVQDFGPEILHELENLLSRIDISLLREFCANPKVMKLNTTSFEEYHFISDNINLLPALLQSCKILHNTSGAVLDPKYENIIAQPGLKILANELVELYDIELPISELGSKNVRIGTFDKIKMNSEKIKTKAQKLLSSLKSIENTAALVGFASSYGYENYNQLSIGQIIDICGIAETRNSVMEHKMLIDSYQVIPGNENIKLQDIYSEIQHYSENTELFRMPIADALIAVKNAKHITQRMGVSTLQVSTLPALFNDQFSALWEYLSVYNLVHSMLDTQHVPQMNRLHELYHKQLEYQNALRMEQLKPGQMMQIQTKLSTGKRLSRSDVDTILTSLGAVLASPSTISRYFPMEEEMIDLLIIDEASQVSIADSISLLLRAKQVIVFGDEFQYGAVSAVNVNKKYRKEYFRKVIDGYRADTGGGQDSLVEADSILNAFDTTDESDQSVEVINPRDMPGKIEWLKTFDIRTSTLAFCKAVCNYSTSLREHFRCYPEIIGYSNEFFYKQAQMELEINRIRTKPITQVLQFARVVTQGTTSENQNRDECDYIVTSIKELHDSGYRGTIGIITSHREQEMLINSELNRVLPLNQYKEEHKLSCWFVADVQGEERDIIYYSLVEDKDRNIGNLKSIYPVIEGEANNPRNLKKQRLNVGFSRAKNTMVFVHSQDIEKFSDTALGEALNHYQSVLTETQKQDFFVEDEAIFGSPMEKNLYSMLLQTEFVQQNRESLRIIPQFPIGKYIRAEFRKNIPNYRCDFLVVYSVSGREQSLILEYDGLEYHFTDGALARPSSMEFIEYDVARQIELELYGYRFLRINKFTLSPKDSTCTPVTVLNTLLAQSFTQ
jgi:hypothetical protein